ncbi:MAG: Hemin transport system permease protein HmuU, partial [Chlamydiae bacterium]|nr:Hemin transport system permease protein HmuU [Chlamydiota bacterium]
MSIFRKDTSFYLLFGLLLTISGLVTLTAGATPLEQVWNGILDRIFHHSSVWNPLLDERLPRLIVLLCTGASLAVSGAVLQSLFHNPLASPSVLGISCGGSLFVTLTLI